MADQIIIRMSIGENGELQQDPHPARVNPNDSVVWIAEDGKLTVDFPEGGNPFVGSGSFSAEKRMATAPGRVRPDVPSPKKFVCTVKIGDRIFEKASGVDTPGSGRMS
jgi:hypothetical protein